MHPQSTHQVALLTTHARVLVAIARDPETRIRDIAAAVSITERAVQIILTDLESAGYLTRSRTGRRNHYTINTARPLDGLPGGTVGDLLGLFLPAPAGFDQPADQGHRRSPEAAAP